MDGNVLYNVRNVISSFPGGASKVNSFVWGQYVKQPGTNGVISLNGEIYTYLFDDMGQSLFVGPMNQEEAIGFIAGKLGLDAGNYSLSTAESFMINRRRSYSLEEIEIHLKKKALEEKKDLIASKLNQGGPKF